MTFEERSKIAMELLSKQGPVTYEEMLEQARRVEQRMIDAGVKRLHGSHSSNAKPKDKPKNKDK